jgi:hypothetical protein
MRMVAAIALREAAVFEDSVGFSTPDRAVPRARQGHRKLLRAGAPSGDRGELGRRCSRAPAALNSGRPTTDVARGTSSANGNGWMIQR